MSMIKPRTLLLLALLVVLAACRTPAWGQLRPQPVAAPTQALPIVTLVKPTTTLSTGSLPTMDASGTEFSTRVPTTDALPATAQAPALPTPTLAPDAWKSMPVIPVVSVRMQEVYRAGLASGRDPGAFFQDR